MSAEKEAVLAKLHQLPSLSALVQEVIASFGNADLDTASLAKKISHDQGLSAQVLRVANSSFYGVPRKVGSIQDAVVVLGFNTVRSLALSAGILTAFPASPGSKFDRQAYLQRSFRIATLSKALASNLQQMQQLAFTSGMFCDIGQLALDLCIPQQFSALLQRQKTSALSLIELEQNELGFDHADIGAQLIQRWNFPAEIEQVARHWHAPELQASSNPLVCLVHVAALLEQGIKGETLMSHMAKNGCAQMQISWESIEACLPHLAHPKITTTKPD